MFSDLGGSVPADNFWQESTLTAARMIEKYIHQEQQNLHLSDWVAHGQNDYDRNGAIGQYLVTHRASSPHNFPVVSDKTTPVKTGSLGGTSYMYRAVGSKLWLWDVLDKSSSRACVIGPLRYDIVSVGVAESRESTTSSHWLVIATLYDVSLYYFRPNSVSALTPPIPSGYVATTGGCQISSIVDMNETRRIFLGGTDGSVFEFVYKTIPDLSQKSLYARLTSFASGETDRRSYLSILHRPAVSLLPPLLQRLAWFLSPASVGSVSSLAIDSGRQVLFAVSGRSSLSMFSLQTNALLADLSEYTISESVKAAYKSAPASFQLDDSPTAGTEESAVVAVVPCTAESGGDFLCVLVTKTGARIYVKQNRGYSPFTTNAIPSSISVAAVRVPFVSLSVVSVLSPDHGKTFVLTSTDGGVVVIRPEESCVVKRQSSDSATAFKYTERFDVIQTSSSTTAAAGGSVSAILAPARSLLLLSVASEETDSRWRCIVAFGESEVEISPLTVKEQLVELVKTKNFNAVRDFTVQWGSDQLGALLLSALAVYMQIGGFDNSGGTNGEPFVENANVFQSLEAILFDFHTAASVGLVDLPAMLPAASAAGIWNTQTIPTGPLGSALHTQSEYVSARSRGIALLLSRVLRPVWFAKAFTLHTLPSAGGEAAVAVVLKPGMSPKQRYLTQQLVEHVGAVLHHYRHDLAGQDKVVDGFLLVLEAVKETLSLMHLVETGKLVGIRKRAEGEVVAIENSWQGRELMESVDALLVRDIVSAAGPGEPVLIDLFRREGIDISELRNHCRLTVPIMTAAL